MRHTIVEPGRVQSWRRKGIKQHLLGVLFDQLSNRFTFNQTVPGAGDKKVPTTVVHKVSDSFREGEYKTTILSLRKPANAPAILGPNSASGKEYKNTTKIVSIFYNVQRFPMVVKDRSVSGRTNNFYKMAEATADVINTLMGEQTDEDYNRAMVEGSEQSLWDPAAWENSEYGSDINHPVDRVLHPNIYWWNGTAATKNTWDPTYATAVTALATAVDANAAMANTATMSLAALDTMHLIATRKIAAIGGMAGIAEVKWVLILSDAQWYQLSTESSTGFRDLLKYTEKGIDRVINGYHGVYKNMMILVSQRQPLFSVSSATVGAFQYIGTTGDGRTRVAKGDNTGTLECAYLCGAGAWGLADIDDLDYEREGTDYNFNKGMCGIRTKGVMRVDLDLTVAATANRENESSLMFLTATNSAVITT